MDAGRKGLSHTHFLPPTLASFLVFTRETSIQFYCQIHRPSILSLRVIKNSLMMC